MMMIEDDDDCEIEKIEKKLTKKNSIWYLVKWVGSSTREWIQASDLSYAQETIDIFQRKLKFKNELKSYVSQKASTKNQVPKNVIVIDSEEEVKSVILISDSEEQKRNQPCETGKVTEDVSPINNQMAVQEAEQQQIQDLIPDAASQDMIDVPRYNYLRGEWEIVKRSKQMLMTAAFVRQVFDQRKAYLPQLKVIKVTTLGNKKVVRFECKGKIYQSNYDTLKLYRPTQILEYFESKKETYPQAYGLTGCSKQSSQ